MHEAVAISTCNRTEVYLVVGDPVEAEAARARDARAPGRHPPDRAGRGDLLAAQLRRRAPALPRDRGPGVDDRRRGRGPGPGQARLRAGAAAPAPTGPLTNRLFARRAGDRQARAHARPRSARAARRACPRSPSTLARERARRPARAPRGDPRRRRDERADRAGAGRRRARARSSSPTAAPTARVSARAALRRRGRRRSTSCPTELERADIVVSSTSSPHPIVGREELELRDGRARARPAAAADRHRRAARRRPGVRASSTASTLYDIDDLQAVVARNLAVRAARGAARAEEIVEEEIQRFAALARPARRAADGRARCASTATTIVEQVLAENAGRWESASERDLARVEAIARAVVSRLLHEPTIRLKQPRRRARARRAAARCASCSALDEAPPRRGTTRAERGRGADARADAARRAAPRRAARLMRIGTRGSALALAQAALVGGRCSAARELVPRSTTARRPRRAGVGDKSRWVDELEAALLARRDRPRRALGQGRARRAGRRARARRAPRRAPTPRDALCGAPSLDELPAGARVGHEQPAPRARSCAPRARTSRSWRCAATSTRGCASSPTASATRSCSRWPACSASGARTRPGGALDGASCPAPGQGTLALEARAGRRAARGAAARAIDRRADAAPACSPSARSRARSDASCHTPVGAHAARRPTARCAARFVGLPDGSAWVRDELATATGDPEALGREVRGAAARRAARRAAATRGGEVGGAEPAGASHLVGAGPGDPGLLTARALELIARADVILYDRLIPRGGARRRARRTPSWSTSARSRRRAVGAQEEIDARCWSSTRARASAVVRLKGGDPFVFGRGGEEAQALRAAGIAFEVVPGVTAGVAAPAYAGIPVTHRDRASAVALRHRPRGPGQAGDARSTGTALAALPRDARLLHGRAALPRRSRERLIAGGRAGRRARGGRRARHAARAAHRRRRRWRRSPTRAARGRRRPPAITVVGAGRGAGASALAWLERAPAARAHASRSPARARRPAGSRRGCARSAPRSSRRPRSASSRSPDDVARPRRPTTSSASRAPTASSCCSSGSRRGRDARALAGATRRRDRAGHGAGAARARDRAPTSCPSARSPSRCVEALADVPADARAGRARRGGARRAARRAARARRRGRRRSPSTRRSPSRSATTRSRPRGTPTTSRSPPPRPCASSSRPPAAGRSPAARIVSIGPVTSETLREHGLEPRRRGDASTTSTVWSRRCCHTRRDEYEAVAPLALMLGAVLTRLQRRPRSAQYAAACDPGELGHAGKARQDRRRELGRSTRPWWSGASTRSRA